jgi:PmbA protein
MNKQEKIDLAKWAINQAKEVGAKDASVSIYNYEGTDIEVRKQEIEKIQKSIESGLSIALYVDGKYSSHSTNRLDRAELRNFIIEAVKATKYLGEDKFRKLPNPELYFKGKEKDLKLVDADFDKVDIDKKIALAMQAEKETIGMDDRIINVKTSYGDAKSESVKVTSNGFEGVKTKTTFSLSASASINGGDSRPQDYDYVTSRFFKDIKADKIGKNAVNSAIEKIGSEKIETGKFDMIIENRVVSRILSGLVSVMSGSALQQKSSFLEGMKGKKIASSALTITDNPFIPSASSSKMFDGEGLKAKERKVVENGVLKTYFIDTYYANKMGVEPTTGGTSNLEFKHGSKDLDALVKSVKNGILVKDFNGGNSNGTTGDFSYGVSGHLIKNGKIVKAISGMNITDNHKKFWNKLVEVGSDELTDRSWRTPSMKFKNIAFSGK